MLPLSYSVESCGDLRVQHVVLYFKHDIQDIIRYSNAVTKIRQLLADNGAGEYVEDDMAIDGGDAEAVLRGPNADTLYEVISPALKELPFLHGARVTWCTVRLVQEYRRNLLN